MCNTAQKSHGNVIHKGTWLHLSFFFLLTRLWQVSLFISLSGNWRREQSSPSLICCKRPVWLCRGLGDLHITPWKTSGGLTSPASNYQEQVLWPHRAASERPPLYGKPSVWSVPERLSTAQVPGKDSGSDTQYSVCCCLKLFFVVCPQLKFQLAGRKTPVILR